VQRYVERFLQDVRTTAPSPTTPAETHGGFLILAATLGKRTAELHLALARRTGDPAFDPEPLRGSDVAAFKQRAADEAASTLDLLRQRLAQLPASTRDQAQTLLAKPERVRTRIMAGENEKPGGLKTRFHGDYHLGQVLVTANDFVIIDFEGEPARSLEERRAKSSPLRDVAGMLRSFNYARWSALERVALNLEERGRLESAAREWELATREAFLAAYRETMALADPAMPVDADLLRLFELEKAMYELRYELNNRINWAQVPLQGILAQIDAG
ncbi:MAG: phosphotransferase, partial [Vicinamibacteria bacterium]|nr:phosphotransferase [Vicinamibacteria bacterium]